MGVLVGPSSLVGPGPLVGGCILSAGGGAPPAAPILARPTITGEDSVYLEWTGGTGSDLIERSTNAGSSWSTVASGQATPYTATGQTEITSQDVWYRVKAGGTSGASNSGIVRLIATPEETGTYALPVGATDRSVDLYAGGANGSSGGTGGGGGAFSRKALDNSETTYNYFIPPGTEYGDGWFGGTGFSDAICRAAGAAPGVDGGAGGDASSGIGDLCTSGGNGGAASNGSGGGAGGPDGNGGNGSSGGPGGTGGGGLAGTGGAFEGAGLNFGGGGAGQDFTAPGAGAPGAVAVTCTKAA